MSVPTAKATTTPTNPAPINDFLLDAYVTQFNDDRQSIGGDLQNIIARAEALLASTTPGTSQAAFISGIITSAQDIAAKSQDQSQAVLQIAEIARGQAPAVVRSNAETPRAL